MTATVALKAGQSPIATPSSTEFAGASDADAAKRRDEALCDSDEGDQRFYKARATSPELNKHRRTLEQAKMDIARSNQEQS